MGYKVQSPICIIGFNRPNHIRKVMTVVRSVSPTRLYIVQDGARVGKKSEMKLCEEVRHIVKSFVDWDCEVFWKVRERNAGCRKNVSEGISWFFENEEEGIILEDDCVPDISFFTFCDELLAKYRNTPRVGCISGNNFAEPVVSSTVDSYHFSIFNHCWGWASWRRAWKKYDAQMSTFNECEMREYMLKNLSFTKKQADYWIRCFKGVATHKIDTWDYAWTYSFWHSNFLSCLPKVNLVKNIGFDDEGTHTHAGAQNPAEKLGSLSKPLVHPIKLIANTKADQYTMGHIFVRKLHVKLKSRFKKYLGMMNI